MSDTIATNLPQGDSSTNNNNNSNVYAALSLCHGVYIAEFDQLKGPMVLLDRPKSFDNARFRSIIAAMPRKSNSGFFMPGSAAGVAGGTVGAHNVVELQGRLMETADRIARRLLAGSVGDSSDFLEEMYVEDEDDDEGDNNNNHHQDGGGVKQQQQQQRGNSSVDDDDARDKRHSFFSTFLDAVPVSRRTSHATYQDANNTLLNANNSITTVPGSIIGGGGAPSVLGGMSTAGTVATMTGHTSNNNNNNSSSGRPQFQPRIYVQNDAGLETCVVCACTFAVPDIYARGYRRDVTIFAICPRVGWGTIAPRVSEALRVFGSRMCDNAMKNFFDDLALVCRAVTKSHLQLQQLHKQRQLEEQQRQQEIEQQRAEWEATKEKRAAERQERRAKRREEKRRKREAELHERRQKQQQEQQEDDDDAGDDDETEKKGLLGSTNNENDSISDDDQQQEQGDDDDKDEEEFKPAEIPREVRQQYQQEHFRRRRTEEEYNALTTLAKRIQLDVSVSTTDESALKLTPAEEAMAAKCRARGQEQLRSIADLCPIVWEEEAPATTAEALFPVNYNNSLNNSSGTINNNHQQQQRQSQNQQQQQLPLTPTTPPPGRNGPLDSLPEPFAVVACGPRHWEAAQVLLSKFAPVFLPAPPQNPNNTGLITSGGTFINSSASTAMTANMSFTSLQSAMDMTSPTSSPGNANSSHHNSSSHHNLLAPTVIPFQFNGQKFHETRWNLRGYVFMPVSDAASGAPEGSSSSSCGMGVSSQSAPTRPQSDYAAAVAKMQQLLPSILLRAQEMFPRIASTNVSGGGRISPSLSRAQSMDKNQVQSMMQQERRIQERIMERTVLPLFSDAPGQFFRKYKAAVESLPVAARECVLPTVALFPSFGGERGRY